jgi:hypothetical protein
MIHWFIGLVLAFFVMRLLWRAYTHPAHVLGRQAANMNWLAVGRVTDIDGKKDLKVGRDGMEAIISFKNGNVVLLKPLYKEPFNDFIELERWLASNKGSERPPVVDNSLHGMAFEKSKSEALVSGHKSSNANLPITPSQTGTNTQKSLNKELFDAIEGFDEGRIRRAIEAGADVNAWNDKGWNPLMLAVGISLALSQEKRNSDLISMLTQAGADINVRDQDGFTALTLATAKRANPFVLSAFLSLGADVNSQDEKIGWTALMWAVADYQNPKAAIMLLNAGANPDIKNKTGQTACELIKSNKALYNTEVYLRLKDFENGRGNRTNRENT